MTKTTEKDGPEKPYREHQILITEEQFVATERTIIDLLTKRRELDKAPEMDSAGATEFEAARIQPLTDKIFELYDDVRASPPLTQRCAAIKLRGVTNPALGLDEDDFERDSLLQVVAFLERDSVIQVPGFLEPEPARETTKDVAAERARTKTADRTSAAYYEAIGHHLTWWAGEAYKQAYECGSISVPPPDERPIINAYAALLDEWIVEDLSSALDARACCAFIEINRADHWIREAIGDGTTPLGEDKKRYYVDLAIKRLDEYLVNASAPDIRARQTRWSSEYDAALAEAGGVS